LFTLLLSTNVMSKSRWSLKSGISMGFHMEPVYLWKYKLHSNVSSGIYLSAGYEYFITPKLAIGTHPTFYQYYNAVTINDIKVKGFQYTVELPLFVRYRFYNKWSAYLGSSIKNYRDFEDQSLEKSSNIRVDLLLGGTYRIHEKFAIDFNYSAMVSKKIESLIVKRSPHHVNVGIIYFIGQKSKNI